jgi:superfamily II DNA or RNA helicase
MELRDYQLKCRDAIFKEWEENRSTLIVLPTGAGKTVVFADVIRHASPQRAIVVVHREELAWQARDTILRNTGLECSIEKAELVASTNVFFRTPVVIATVQTLTSGGEKKRITRFDPNDFGIVICDESHHATSPTWKYVVDYFLQNPALKVLGVTATPDRADEEALGQVFQTVAFDYEILDAIHDGWLVPVAQQMVTVAGLDFSNIRTTAGDLNGADLAAVMEAETTMQGVCGASIQIIGIKRALIFTASVKQAEIACSIFNRHRPGMAAFVHGGTPKDERSQMLSEFRRGAIQVICNCAVLTEGFDDAGVEVIVMARPTKSRSLYAQMAGRSTRPLPGLVDNLATPDERKAAIEASEKPQCLIVDFVGNSGKHKLMSTADILGGNVSWDAIARAKVRAREEGVAMRMVDIIEEEEEKMKKEKEERLRLEQARKAKLLARVHYSSKSVSPFDIFDISPGHERGWDKDKHLSEKQRMLLLRQGIDPSKMTFNESKRLIQEMFRRWNGKLCTFRQAALLKKHIPELNTKNMTMEQASLAINKISKMKGWRNAR